MLPIKSGDTIGKWRVLWAVPFNGKRAYLCRCSCGREQVVRRFQSEGCRKCCVKNIRHGCAGKKRTPEYRVWQGIRHRCLNPKDPSYPNYGGRGITICNRWMSANSFEVFLADVGPRPSDLHSLDRINNDGNYAPENVRWATRSEQVKNRRPLRAIENFSDDALRSEIWRRTPEYGMTAC